MPVSNSAPAGKLVKLTKGSPVPTGCRSLLVGTAGTANLTDGMGNVHTNVPLYKGTVPIEVKALAAGGTADDIWGLF